LDVHYLRTCSWQLYPNYHEKKEKKKSKRKHPAFPNAVLAFCFLNRKARLTCSSSRMSQVTKAEPWNPTHMLGTCFL